jgi:hypothetical protein
MRKLFFVFFFVVQHFIYAQQSNYVIGPKFPLFCSYGISLFPEKQVVYFPAESYTSGTVEKVEFRFYKHFDRKDTVSMKLPIMLKIYARDTLNNIPGAELLKDTVMIFNQKKSKVILDISKYNITLPVEGIYCGLASFCTEWYIDNGYLTADNLFYNVKGPMRIVYYTPMVAGARNKKGIYKNYALGGYAKEWKDITETYESTLFIRLHIRK